MPKSILLAEDDPFLLDIYGSKLKYEGFKVDTASDGLTALQKAKDNPPDLLVLDILLPKMDGWQVLEEIRKDPKTKEAKVIIISNLDPQSFPENIFNLGVIKYFLKVQTTPEEMAKEIKEILK